MLEASIKLSYDYFDESDKTLAKSYLSASNLCLKTYNMTKALFYYEKYYKVLKKVRLKRINIILALQSRRFITQRMRESIRRTKILF